jgi:hypothetical protein
MPVASTRPKACEHDNDRGRDPDGGVGGGESQRQSAERHHHDQQRERPPPPVAVRIGAEHDAADRPHHESHREGRISQHQRKIAARREKHLGDDAGEISVGDEIEPFEPVA